MTSNPYRTRRHRRTMVSSALLSGVDRGRTGRSHAIARPAVTGPSFSRGDRRVRSDRALAPGVTAGPVAPGSSARIEDPNLPVAA